MSPGRSGFKAGALKLYGALSTYKRDEELWGFMEKKPLLAILKCMPIIAPLILGASLDAPALGFIALCLLSCRGSKVRDLKGIRWVIYLTIAGTRAMQSGMVGNMTNPRTQQNISFIKGISCYMALGYL